MANQCFFSAFWAEISPIIRNYMISEEVAKPAI
jgi:hypothetical protein